MTKYKDTDGNTKTSADFGAVWLSDEMVVMLGLVEVSDDYEKPQSTEEIKQQKLKTLQDGYNADVQQLKERITAGMLTGGTTQVTMVAAAQSEFATRKAKYAADRAAIINA